MAGQHHRTISKRTVDALHAGVSIGFLLIP